MIRKLLRIDRVLVHSYLQCKVIDASLETSIQEATQLLLSVVTPRIVYKEYELRDGQPSACGLSLEGNDIKAILHDSERCSIVAGTLGQKVDQTLRILQLQDMGKAFIFDACANAAIEQLMDEFHEEQQIEKRKEGWYLSDRFAPGYGDFPIELQADLINEIDAKRKIGLHITDSNLLIPSKSITGIVGVSRHIQPAILRGCEVCAMQATCNRRKEGAYCGKNKG